MNSIRANDLSTSRFRLFAFTSEKEDTLPEDSVAEEVGVAEVIQRRFRHPVGEAAKVLHHDPLDEAQVAYLQRRVVSQDDGGPEELVSSHAIVLEGNSMEHIFFGLEFWLTPRLN